ncbi:uncharacterized protein [Linepithema humile]|uniref:uncharacterized protein n=1 Tax=Linepithema humile TaxID=83485 RepID=UPI00351DC58A
MYSVSIFLLILAVWIDGFSLEDVYCNQKCQGDVNNYNVVGYNSSVINYCTTEDVPDEFNFTVWSDNGKGEFNSVKIEFAPPKRKCIYGIALLVNPLIEDERECREYKFEEAKDINSTIHTIEKTLCIHMNTNQFVRYNDNSTVPLCKDNIGLWFHYIFTGCYALRFHLDKQKYLIRAHNFLNTTYQRTEVKEPQFICNYNTYSDLDQRKGLLNFTLDISLSADTGPFLELAIINHDKDEKSCIWRGQKSIRIGTVYLKKDNRNCSIKLIQTVSGEYVRNVVCNFQVRVPQSEGYCFIFWVIDDRCHKNTLWKPPSNEMFLCTWIKRCQKTSDNSLHIDNAIEIKSDKLLNTSSYLLLPIIAIVFIVSAIIGTLCFLHYLRIRKEEVTLYVNPRPDDFLNSACLKSDFGIIENNDTEKEIDHDNSKCDDIVLLYTKNSTSFMALMKDFRETLAKICSCSIHDWHDGAEWNDVAKVGAVLWFSELLNNGCRVIWVDTPATRSIVTSNSKESALNKFSKYYEIGDFRDMAFPVVLELAKRNTKNTVFQYRRHFVVRFEGLESTANGNDPFLDLSPHARYRMPQHLAQLCSDLLVVKTAISLYQMKAEEDLLQQRLMKMESLM